MIRERAYDVSELGMTYFLRATEVDPAFVAIPCFQIAPSPTCQAETVPVISKS